MQPRSEKSTPCWVVIVPKRQSAYAHWPGTTAIFRKQNPFTAKSILRLSLCKTFLQNDLSFILVAQLNVGVTDDKQAHQVKRNSRYFVPYKTSEIGCSQSYGKGKKQTERHGKKQKPVPEHE